MDGVGGDWGGGDDEVSGPGDFGEGWRVGKRWGVGGSTDFLGRGQRGRERCVGWGGGFGDRTYLQNVSAGEEETLTIEFPDASYGSGEAEWMCLEKRGKGGGWIGEGRGGS